MAVAGRPFIPLEHLYHMSGFFSWCASVRKAPKDAAPPPEDNGDEFEDGVGKRCDLLF